MAYLYSECDLTRKFRTIKNSLYKDGFYRDKVVCRNISVVGKADDDIYEENTTYKITDIVVDAIAEPGVIFNNFNNMIEVESGDIRLTVREEDGSVIEDAESIWVGVDVNDDIPLYDDDVTKEFTQGVSYKIKSKKPSIMGLDEIYILGLSGGLS
jgi:hypothetical protein